MASDRRISGMHGRSLCVSLIGIAFLLIIRFIAAIEPAHKLPEPADLGERLYLLSFANNHYYRMIYDHFLHGLMTSGMTNYQFRMMNYQVNGINETGAIQFRQKRWFKAIEVRWNAYLEELIAMPINALTVLSDTDVYIFPRPDKIKAMLQQLDHPEKKDFICMGEGYGGACNGGFFILRNTQRMHEMIKRLIEATIALGTKELGDQTAFNRCLDANGCMGDMGLKWTTIDPSYYWWGQRDGCGNYANRTTENLTFVHMVCTSGEKMKHDELTKARESFTKYFNISTT